MKKLTDSVVRQIVSITSLLHLPNYDRGELSAPLWHNTLNFASYAGFDVTNELARVNSYIKDDWMKFTITPLEENRQAYALMDDCLGAGGHNWSEEFETQLAAVMAI
jgi:hypothetical protein